MNVAQAMPLLRRLAEQFAAAVAEGSDTHEIEGFRVHLWASPDPFYRNVAIPTDAACLEASSVARMQDLFAAHARTPRLEFFAELWPGLAPVLESAGLTLDREAQVMVRRPGDELPAPLGGEAAVLLDAGQQRVRLQAFLAAAATAFAETGPLNPGEVDRLAAGLARGTIAAAGSLQGREPVAGASLIRVGPVAELAGVWTLPDWRRRGLARACCRLLLERFFGDGGEIAWLSAGGPAGQALYGQLGFRPCGTQLNYSRPATA
ncbi:MAG: GNAT family N-acetyltransferase [Geminicoccaceae bacterium]